MVTTTLEDVTSVDEAKVYSDSALTALVETLTPANFTKTATGVYLNDDAFDYSLYVLGTVYYLKITWTPVGAVQRSDSIPFMIAPQGQAAGAASLTSTDCRHAKHLQNPVLMLRVGRGGFREADFENGIESTQDRFAQELGLPDDAEGHDLHLEISTARAGAPLALERIVGRSEILDDIGDGQSGLELVDLPVPLAFGKDGGYRGTAYSNRHFLRRSANVSVHPDVPRTRKGFSQRRAISSSTADYMERIPIDEQDGSFAAVLYWKANFYTDAASPSALTGDGHGAVTEAYGAATAPIPSWVYMLGRAVFVNGVDADFRVLMIDAGGAARAKPPIGDPPDPTLSAITGTDNIKDTTWFVRIRERDTDTDTRSGPNARTSSAPSQVLASGEVLRVEPAAFDTRVDKWQIQLAELDAPESYRVVTEVYNAATGGSKVADANGWIDASETDVYVRAVPASGASRFEFRSVRGVSVYRHSNPPTGAAFVTQFRNRAFYAADDETWLVFSEPGNPEHFYTDPDSPHAGFNTFRGESLVDTIASPCKGLAATRDHLLFFRERGITVFGGSFVLEEASDGSSTFAGRDVWSDQVEENSLGAICSSFVNKDQFVFFVSPEGPSVYLDGQAEVLDAEAVRADWECRDPVYDHRAKVGYDPDTDEVLFSFVSKNARVTGVPDVTLAYHLGKKQFSAPYDLDVTSWTLHRDQDDAGNEKGSRLFFGGPYGVLNEYGVGFGDGEDGSDADAADLNSTSETTTSATVSGKSWTTDEWKGFGLVLTDRTTGRRYYRTIKSNTGDTLNWDGAVSDSGGGWKLNIGGIRTQLHLLVPSQKTRILRLLRALLQDQISILA